MLCVTSERRDNDKGKPFFDGFLVTSAMVREEKVDLL